MNDSSWGAPPQAGYWGPSERGPVQGAAPAGPAYDARYAQQTRPMPIVPDVPDFGSDQDDDRGAARPGVPPFRDQTSPAPAFEAG
ncbi:phosphatidate cytidylyltransferase, partial [Streptomyces sp. TRM76130]|nr:phosphatidate cytidylyltransferase [Streptomyces sp. TRM76130]